MAAVDYAFGAVQSYDRCPTADECPHCAAGRPSAPVEAGDPRDLSMAVADVDDAMRAAMPPAYHRPEFSDLGKPAGWFCACCWDDGSVMEWPCTVALRHGTYLRRSMMLEYAVARKAGIAAPVS